MFIIFLPLLTYIKKKREKNNPKKKLFIASYNLNNFK